MRLGEAIASRLPGTPVHAICDAAAGLGLIRDASAAEVAKAISVDGPLG